jgi:hypothetical protein
MPEADVRRSPSIIVHRYVISSLLHTQRCRLHLPYLSRAHQGSYSYSKEACLEAARMVIRTEVQISSENIPFVLTRLKFAGSLLCVCMAIIALLMDFCHHKSLQPDEDQERRSEIQDALRILEKAKASPYSRENFSTSSTPSSNATRLRSLPKEDRLDRSRLIEKPPLYHWILLQYQ